MRRFCILVLLLIFGMFLYAQDDGIPFTVRLMFYNVENLFDINDEPVKDDNEFLPGGLRRWNLIRYKEKLSSVYKVVTAAGEWTPPALIGLCEIENREVLEDLINGTYLSNFNYGIIHNESPDSRGIDVAFLFRKDLVRVLDHRSWIPASIKKEDFTSRSVLYIKCEIFSDTLHLFINHWPSRRGGVLSGEPLRSEIAAMVRAKADSLNRTSAGSSKIIIMGDFNCTPGDPVIKKLVSPPDLRSQNSGMKLVNLADPFSSSTGTYRYMGTWEMLDQIIVSDFLLKCATEITTDKKNFRIFRPDFLLKNDLNYPGLTTFSTYRGYRYQGGFSDHLPVLLDLTFK